MHLAIWGMPSDLIVYWHGGRPQEVMVFDNHYRRRSNYEEDSSVLTQISPEVEIPCRTSRFGQFLASIMSMLRRPTEKSFCTPVIPFNLGT
jgi:hypothetical protein